VRKDENKHEERLERMVENMIVTKDRGVRFGYILVLSIFLEYMLQLGTSGAHTRLVTGPVYHRRHGSGHAPPLACLDGTRNGKRHGVRQGRDRIGDNHSVSAVACERTATENEKRAMERHGENQHLPAVLRKDLNSNLVEIRACGDASFAVFFRVETLRILCCLVTEMLVDVPHRSGVKGICNTRLARTRRNAKIVSL
jgi:hypothetical protein